MDLRMALKSGPLTTYTVTSDTIVTPSARAFMAEKGIQLIVEQPGKAAVEPAVAAHVAPGPVEVQGGDKARFVCMQCGGKLDEKPEFMTHLRGNRLVPKTHPRIKLRGLLDLTESFIIHAQVEASQAGMGDLVKHLDELLDYTRQVLRAEVLDAALPEMKIMGMTAAEIREVSHNPAATLGIKHILPSYQMGPVMSAINIARTCIRQAELYAVEAFWTDPFGEPARKDILEALNRLSSAAYVMMCKLAAGKYGGGKSK